MDTDDSLKSCRVTTGGQVLGIGVWLCFICCPLQGGSYLQPTHEPVNPKPVLLNLDPKKLFFDLSVGRAMALYVGQMKLQVYQLFIPFFAGSVRLRI